MLVYQKVLCFVQYLGGKIGLLRRLGNSVLMTAILLAMATPEGTAISMVGTESTLTTID
jgi:hypothetical protein